MKVRLKKAYKNHPKGTELDVSMRVKASLVKGGFIPGPRAKAPAEPPADKMVKDAPEAKDKTKKEGAK